jgi:apolipoprotein N-acyltransferase
MRAIETGRYVLRATTSGISAVIDNYGNIVKQAPVFKKFVLISQYQDCFNQTIWNKLGNKLIIGFLLICLGVSKVKFSRVL